MPGVFRIPRFRGSSASVNYRRLERYIPAGGMLERAACLREDLGTYLKAANAGEYLIGRINSLTVVDAAFACALKDAVQDYQAKITIVNLDHNEADLRGESRAVAALGIRTNCWFAIRADGPDAALALKHLQSFLTSGDFEVAEIVENTAMREMAFKGRPLTAKIAISKALVLKETLDLEAFPIIDMAAEAAKCSRTVDEQMSMSLEAMSNAVREMEESLVADMARARAAGRGSEEQMAEMFQYLLADSSVKILGLMEENKICAAAAIGEFLKNFDNLKHDPDPKQQASYLDIYSLCIKLLAIRHKKSIDIREEIDNCRLGDHIMLVAENIAASDSGVIADRRIDGAVREKGAPKDHLSIRLRDNEKAGVIAAAGVTSFIHTGDTVIVDGRTGRIILNPTPATLEHYELLKAEYDRLDEFLKEKRAAEPVTLDGHRVQLMGNAASVSDVDSIVNQHQLAGTGLVRTELFFCEKPDLSQRSEEPGIEEQVGFYNQVIKTSGGREVIFRTVDVDPDKTFPYFQAPVETVVGEHKKGLGLCLDEENNAPYYFLFRNQLKSLLLTTGKAEVMFPLVKSNDEFTAAMAVMAQVAEELRADGKAVNEQLVFGIMIEHPAILKGAVLPEQAMFFSLGTSDLTQFITSVNRYSALQNFDELDPRVLKAIAEAVDKAGKAHKPISCCGDMGNDWRSMLVMMALGLDKFSVSTGVSDLARYIIRNIKHADLAALRKGIEQINTAREIRHFIDDFTHRKMKDSWSGLLPVEKLLFAQAA